MCNGRSPVPLRAYNKPLQEGQGGVWRGKRLFASSCVAVVLQACESSSLSFSFPFPLFSFCAAAVRPGHRQGAPRTVAQPCPGAYCVVTTQACHGPQRPRWSQRCHCLRACSSEQLLTHDKCCSGEGCSTPLFKPCEMADAALQPCNLRYVHHRRRTVCTRTPSMV